MIVFRASQMTQDGCCWHFIAHAHAHCVHGNNVDLLTSGKSAGNWKISCFASKMKREEVLSAIAKATEDKEAFLEVIRKHVGSIESLR